MGVARPGVGVARPSVGVARPGCGGEGGRGGSHVARAHMTGGAMDPLPAAAVAAAADEEADEEADPLAAGKAVGWVGGPPGPAPPAAPRPPAHLLPRPPRAPPGPLSHPQERARLRGPAARATAAGPGSRAPVQVCTSPRAPVRVSPGWSRPLGSGSPPASRPARLRGAHPLHLRSFGLVIWPLRTCVSSSVKRAYFCVSAFLIDERKLKACRRLGFSRMPLFKCSPLVL